MGTNYIAPIWRMPRNANKDKLSNYNMDFQTGGSAGRHIDCGTDLFTDSTIPSISISVWIKTSAAGVIMSKDLSSNTNRNFLFQIAGTQLYWQTTTGSTSSFPDSLIVSQSEFDLLDSEWHHIVVTYNTGTSSGDGEKKIYIDGIERKSDTKATYNPLYNKPSVPINIGRRGDSSRYFYDNMSQVCIFDYALDQDQINYLYNLNNPMAITGAKPIAYWPLGDNSNPNAPGSFPNISVGADSVFDFVPNDYINLNSDILFNTNEGFTFSSWVNLDSYSDPYPYLANLKTNVTDGIGIFISNNSSYAGVNVGSTDSSITKGRTTGDISSTFLNSWNNVVVTYNGNGANTLSNFSIYVNGLPVALTTTGNYSTMPNTANNIGRRSNSYHYLDGKLSNVAIWNSDQSSEISNIYNSGVPATTYTNTPTAWYKLDQSANWEADTTGEWQIPDAVSSYPQSFDFDGSSFMNFGTSLGNSLGDSYAGDLTFSTWIKLPPSSNNQKGIFCIDNTNQPEFGLVNFTNQIWLYTSGNGTNIARFSTSIEDNNWHHLVLVYDADDASNTQLYIDNTPASKTVVNSQPASLNFNGDNTVLGTYYNTAGTFDLTGKLSNSKIWNTALSSTQVETLYNNGVPLTTAIATDNLKAWYKLNDNEKFDGTNWSVENQKYPANFDSALDFNSTQGDFVNIPYNANYDLTGAQTFSFWFNQPTSQSGGSYPITFGSGSAIKFFIQFYDPIGRIITRTADSTGNLVDATNLGVDYVGNGWHHLAFTTDGTTATDKIITYFDGEPLPVKATLANAGILATYSGFYFGKIPNTGFFNGQMSNISYFDKELSASEIQTLYNNGSPELSISHSPIAWWKLNNTTTGIQDSVGSNDGTNNGTTKVNTFVSTEAGTSSGMTEQNLVNNNVSVLNGESSGMDTTNLVQSNLTRTQPYSNYSFNFDAPSSDYINIYSGTIGSLPSEFSIGASDSASFSFWIKSNATTSNNFFYTQRGINPYLRFYTTYHSPTDSYRAYFIVRDDSYLSITEHSDSTNIVNRNQWNHIVGIIDRNASKLYVYVNGVVTGTGTSLGSLGAITQVTDVAIGGDPYPSGSIRFEFDGQISNTSIFNIALSQDDVLNLYNNGISQDLNNFRITPVAWWPMDEHSSYYDGTDWVVRDLINANDGQGANTGNVDDLVGSAPGSEASGVGSNFVIGYLENDMKDSTLNAHSINMGDYADTVTNPANSGISTDTP